MRSEEYPELSESPKSECSENSENPKSTLLGVLILNFIILFY